MVFAISGISASRFMELSSNIWVRALISISSNKSVMVNHGATAFTRTPWTPTSAATVLVAAIKAVFETP